jgi:hypothetical protein
MKLKLIHKGEHTSVINVETGESLPVCAVSFERASVDDLATLTITLKDCHIDLEVDAELDATIKDEASATPDPRPRYGWDHGKPAM